MDVVDLVSDDEDELLGVANVKKEYNEEPDMEFGDQDGYISEYTEEPMEYEQEDVVDPPNPNSVEQNPTAKTFSCEVCSRVFNNRQSLWYHKKTHNPSPPVPCSVCQKIFTNVISLRKHIKCHEKEKKMTTTKQSNEDTKSEVLPSYSQPVVKEEPKFEILPMLQDYHWTEEPQSPEATEDKTIETESTSEERFYCSECPRSYRQAYNLTRHYRTHKLSGPFTCDICGMAFKKQVSLKCHKWRHKEGGYARKAVSRAAKIKVEHVISPSRFPRLAKTAANLQQQQSTEVTSSEARPRPVVKTRKINPKQKRFQCNKCPTSFKHVRNLNRHQVLHLRKGDYPCDICGICFTEEKSMNLHRGKHGDIAKKVSENADKSWESFGEQFTVTMEEDSDEESSSNAVKTEDELLKCPVCNAFFKILENYERHMRWKHNIEPNMQEYTYKMNEPKIEYEEEYETKPQYYELPIKPHYQCEFCRRNFLEKDMHDRHIEAAHYGMTPSTRGKEMDYQEGEIPSTPMVASTSQVVSKAKETISKHYGKRMYCTICSCAFFTKTSLTRHMDTHNETRKLHPCNLCGLEYAWYQDLQSHLKQHERGELIAKCPHCEGRFRTKRGVFRHIGIKHRKGGPSKIVRPLFNHQKLHFRIKKRRVQGRVQVKQENFNGSNEMSSDFADSSALEEEFTQQQSTEEFDAEQSATDPSGSGKLQCTVCFGFFATKPSLSRHMKAHNPHRKMHICRLCGLQYFWYQDLHTHMKNHERGELPAKCPHCNGRFRTEKGVVWHIARHHKYGSDYNSASPRIKRTQAPTRAMQQMVQIKNFKKTIKLEKESASPMKPKYQCKVCFKLFSEKFVLKDHMELHNENRQEYLCPQCGLGYLWVRNLQAHIKQHANGQLKATCPKCNGKFVNKKGVLRHMSKKHKGHEATMDTLEDGLVIEDPQASGAPPNDNEEEYYSAHEPTVVIKQEDGQDVDASTSAEQFECTICPSFFFDRFSLQQHMGIHRETKKMYPCPQCGLEYSWPHDLQSHIKRHERGELTIKCQECDGKFKTNTGLLRHVNSIHKVHKTIPHTIIMTQNIKKMIQRGSKFIKQRNRPTTDGNYRCHVCSKLFHNKNNLKRHMVTHNPNRKMYPCLICGLEYSWYQDLQYHMMRHERGELPCKCPHCEARFKSEKGVMRHVNMKHKDEM